MFAWPGDTSLFVFLCVLKMALTAVSSKAVIILLLIINPTHKQEFETISKQHVNNSHLMHNSLCCSSFFSAKPLLQCYQFATLKHIAISLFSNKYIICSRAGYHSKKVLQYYHDTRYSIA